MYNIPSILSVSPDEPLHIPLPAPASLACATEEWQPMGTAAERGPLNRRHRCVDLRVPQFPSADQKKTYDRTTTFFRHGAPAGAVGSTHAEWKDQRETEPSVTES